MKIRVTGIGGVGFIHLAGRDVAELCGTAVQLAVWADNLQKY